MRRVIPEGTRQIAHKMLDEASNAVSLFGYTCLDMLRRPIEVTPTGLAVGMLATGLVFGVAGDINGRVEAGSCNSMNLNTLATATLTEAQARQIEVHAAERLGRISPAIDAALHREGLTYVTVIAVEPPGNVSEHQYSELLAESSALSQIIANTAQFEGKNSLPGPSNVIPAINYQPGHFEVSVQNITC